MLFQLFVIVKGFARVNVLAMIRGTDPDETDFFSAKMGRVRCDQCEHEAASPELLQKHVDVVHDLIMEFMCDHCEYVTAYTTDLDAHVKRVHSGGQDDSERDEVHIGYKAIFVPSSPNTCLTFKHIFWKLSKCKNHFLFQTETLTLYPISTVTEKQKTW